MFKILSIALLISLSIFIAIIINAWLLLPVIVSLYFLTKKLLRTEETTSTTTHPVLRFGFVIAAAIFVTSVLSGFFLFLLFLAYLLGFDPDKECKDPNQVANRIACGLFLGNDAFRTNTRKITNAMLPKVNIKVRVLDGSIQPAKLTRIAAGGANIKSEDTLFLTCHVNPKVNVGDYGYAFCNLTLPKAAPGSTNYPEELDARFGWAFGANFQGIADPQILILPQPLVWPPNNATPPNKYK